jgi:hypothetical protein
MSFAGFSPSAGFPSFSDASDFDLDGSVFAKAAGSNPAVSDYLNLGANILGGLGGGGGGGDQGFDFEELFQGALETAKYINDRSDITADETRDILNDITYGITGRSPAEGFSELIQVPGTYYDEGILRAYGATPRIAGAPATPETARSFGRLDSSKQIKDVARISQAFSPLNNEQVMGLSTAPPVVEIDPSVYDAQIDKYLDAATLAAATDYSGEQTQGFLNPDNSGYQVPDRYSREALSRDYGGDEKRKQFMSFSSY